MTPEELATRQDRAQTVPMIISASEGGFRVYSPSDRKQPYVIGGSPSAPICTCPDFIQHQNDSQWRCTHILAVMNQRAGPSSGNGEPIAKSPDTLDRSNKERNGGDVNRSTDPINMLLKRSVSPDGRINSLSIELSCLVAVPDVGTRASTLLKLQHEIEERFLGNGEQRQAAEAPEVAINTEPVPAEILNVGGLDGHYGRRLFLRFQVNGRTLRHFGTKAQLGEFLADAGFPDMTNVLEEDLELGVPCMVTTKRAKNPKYVNIDQVLPVASTEDPAPDAW